MAVSYPSPPSIRTVLVFVLGLVVGLVLLQQPEAYRTTTTATNHLVDEFGTNVNRLRNDMNVVVIDKKGGEQPIFSDIGRRQAENDGK